MLSSLRQASRAVRVARLPAPRPTRFAFARTIVTQKYSEDHESIKFDDETQIGTVSITDFAQTSLGDVVFVELPEVGSTVEKGDTVGAVESVKAASDIYSPVSGEIVEINDTLGDQPALINKSPEEQGWLFKIRVKDVNELGELMTAEQYKGHCEESSDA